MLLENRRHLLIECDVVDFILDLHALRHYGDLLDRIHHCNRILAENSYAELMRANLINKDLRDVPEYLRSSDSEDNFNYEMLDFYVDYMDPRTLEPPALPSILSLQAEYFAIQQAWYYAARKLEQLAALQEHDHRAPKANQLLCVRYNMLSDNIKKAKAGCDNGLNKLFYDYSDFNRMVRWQFLKRLFKQ
jgi:hypothetical protein